MSTFMWCLRSSSPCVVWGIPGKTGCKQEEELGLIWKFFFLLLEHVLQDCIHWLKVKSEYWDEVIFQIFILLCILLLLFNFWRNETFDLLIIVVSFFIILILTKSFSNANFVLVNTRSIYQIWRKWWNLYLIHPRKK